MALPSIPIMVLKYSIEVYKLNSDGRNGRKYNSAISHNTVYYELSSGERTTTSGNLVQSTGIVIYNGEREIDKEDVIQIKNIKYKINSIQLYNDPTVADKVHHTEILLSNQVDTITVV